jgi:hypothetical protein
MPYTPIDLCLGLAWIILAEGHRLSDAHIPRMNMPPISAEFPAGQRLWPITDAEKRREEQFARMREDWRPKYRDMDVKRIKALMDGREAEANATHKAQVAEISRQNDIARLEGEQIAARAKALREANTPPMRVVVTRDETK